MEKHWTKKFFEKTVFKRKQPPMNYSVKRNPYPCQFFGSGFLPRVRSSFSSISLKIE